MDYTVKDFIKIFAMNETIIEVDVDLLLDDFITSVITLVYDCAGERRTLEEMINKFADATVLKTETTTDDYGIVCFTLYINSNDKNIKK